MKHYTYVHLGHKTIAIAKYGGKTIKATSKLDPRDKFDKEIGEQIAGARLRLKILNKKKKKNAARIEQLKKEQQELNNKIYYYYGKEREIEIEIDEIQYELKSY